VWTAANDDGRVRRQQPSEDVIETTAETEADVTFTAQVRHDVAVPAD
jgi:hypothetical protein